ncbi:hypothetical protein Bca4012_053074 [Brassica carinata]|nr:hypothetical protein Bca52824_055615 [Brassica carinata]
MKPTKAVCADLVRGAKDKRLITKGLVRMPTKVLKITTRKAQGTNEWLIFSADVVKQISSITIEPGVEVEVTIADS